MGVGSAKQEFIRAWRNVPGLWESRSTDHPAAEMNITFRAQSCTSSLHPLTSVET